ncbi:MAG: bifunctional glutamate N-acetyltransferase/amino-acid acetyltransferase ArgJ [Neisseriaceae bacterium]|nr:bifunctional glutamate N-acetyltransferase/amino-acid acetyltransferase ArgJ [Neisseriaceae bacterium]
MAVNLTEPLTENILPVAGVNLFVAQAGIKQAHHDDVTLMVLEKGNTMAGVFTQNRFCAAPVIISQKHLNESNQKRALIINTGNANAGTGQQGRDAALAVCQAVAEHLECELNQVLPFSTGVILEPLPSDKIIQSLGQLRPASWTEAARAIMTTDTVPKAASRQIEVDGHTITLTGISKGSGMICPNMATMLGFIATDAALTKPVLKQLIKEVADESFNAITVDGDTSTNDSFIIVSTGKSELALIDQASGTAYQAIKTALLDLALELAQAIIRDGEGATKFITIKVNGARNTEEAKQVGYAIAHSPLIKTAFFASDPNLGRLLCAIGYAGIMDLDVNKVALYLGDVLVAHDGGRAPAYEEAQGAAVMAEPEITVTVELNRGSTSTTVYTCDFSYDYVKINAEYRS